MRGKNAKHDAKEVIADLLRARIAAGDRFTPDDQATDIMAALDREGIRLAFKPRRRMPPIMYQR